MGRPNDAFELMRKLGLGITNKDLEQIPIAADSPLILTESTENNQQKFENKAIITKNIGEEIKLATLKYTVNSVEEVQTMGGSFGVKVAKQNAKFVIINVNIINTTNSEFTFYSNDAFVIIDNQNRQFTTYDDTIGYIDNYLTMRNLSPDLVENGVLVYEMPSDATNYNLVIGKSGTDEIYKVILK